MARFNSSDEGGTFTAPPSFSRQRLRRLALLIGIPLVLGLVLLVVLWNTFFKYVPPNHMLVVISKSGEPLQEGQVLARPGQKGIQEEVLGEGWHFVMPVLYTTELKENLVVPGGRFSADPRLSSPALKGRTRTAAASGTQVPKVGIVKALGGKPAEGRPIVDKGYQGLQREVLMPGSYRLNPYGYEVKLVDMVEIKPGHVGVLRRKLGKDGKSEFATGPDEKGIIKDRVLQPGLYPINTEEYEVVNCDVGIYQTTYHYSKDPKEQNTSLEFDASDGNRIQLDCTIEWELKPEHWPVWLTKFRSLERIQETVIRLNVKAIARNRGQDYGAEDFLDGSKREKFQTDFRMELDKACKEDEVIVRSAFIRNIIIPDKFLQPKRDEQLAREKTITQKEMKLTAETENEVQEAERTVKLEVAKVEATTQKLVAAIERDAENIKAITEAELEKMKDENAAKVAILEAEQTELLGKAKAESKKLVSTARSSLYKMKMGLFSRDTEAFMRYTMAQELNENLRLRLFQSGPGTLWTNMGNKDMNLFMPMPGGERKPAAEGTNGNKGEAKEKKEKTKEDRTKDK